MDLVDAAIAVEHGEDVADAATIRAAAQLLLDAIPPLVEGETGPVIAGSVLGSNRAQAHVGTTNPIQLLVAYGRLTEPEIERVAAVAGPRGPVLWRQLGLFHLANGDVEGAKAAAAHMGERAYSGLRDVAHHLAEAGRAEEFFALWPQLQFATHRRGGPELKAALVRGVASAHGWEAATALTRDKRIGARFRRCAFEPLAATGDVDTLTGLLSGAAAGLLDEVDELVLLVAVIVADSPRSPGDDHPRLGSVLDRIIALDPTVGKEQMRRRDGLLMDLWPAFGDEESLARARTAARTPWIRRELTVLPRDVPSPPPA